jgi:ABC-type lipoprotein release transport system permease subunit
MTGVRLWARSEIRDGWRSLIVVGLLVAVVTGSVLALAAGASRAGSAPDRFAESSDLAELIVFIGDEAPASLVDDVAADPRVERVVVSTVAKIGPGVATPESNAIIGEDGPLGGYGRPLLVSGRYPEPGRTDEILLGESGALRKGVAVGDRVSLSALADLEDEAASIGDAEVVGIVRLSEDLVDNPNAQLVILAGPTLAGGRWQRAETPGRILSLHLADDVDRDALTADLSTIVGSHGNASDQEVDTEAVERAAALQRDALLLLAAVAAAAGVVVVAQAVSRHLQRRPSDAVVLEAVGLTRWQRVLAALASVLPAIVIGAVAGAGLAAAVSPAFPLGSIRRAEPQPGLRFDPALLALGAMVAAIAAAVAATVAASRWARTTPSPLPAGRSAVAAIIERLRLRPPAATGARFALDAGTGNQRLPVVPTLATVSATVAIAIAAIVVHTNLEHLVSTPAQYGQPWDLAVSALDPTLEPVMRDAAEDPLVAGADLTRSGELDATLPDGQKTQIKTVGIEGIGGPTSLVMRSGRPPIGIEEVAMAGDTMADLGVAIGDRIDVRGGCATRSVEVVGEAIVPIIDQGDPGEGIVLSLEGFTAVCAQLLAAQIDRTIELLMRFDDEEDAEAFAAELEADGAPIDRRSVPTDVRSLGDLRLVPAAVGIAVCGFGLIAVAHALVLAVRRRRRDLGVLRALGMRPGEASAAVRWQALTIAVIAALVGIPVGLASGRALWLAIVGPIHVLLDIDVPVPLVLSAGVAAVLAALALAVVPAHRATRLPPAEILRSE